MRNCARDVVVSISQCQLSYSDPTTIPPFEKKPLRNLHRYVKSSLWGVRLEMQNDVVQSATEAYDLAIGERQTKKNDARIRTLPK